MTENMAGASKPGGAGSGVGGVPGPTPLAKTRRPVISTGTWTAAGLMALALFVLVIGDVFTQPGQPLSAGHDLILALQYLMALWMALLILRTTRTFEKNTDVRTNWSLFGYALLAFGAGSVVLIALYAATGKDTYPSFAEAFTIVGYGIFGLAFYRSLLSYRHMLSLRNPLLIALGVSVAVGAVVYATVVGPWVLFPPVVIQSAGARIFNTLYLVLDLVVLLWPCVALALLLTRLGAGRVAWPWWVVVAGAGSLIIPDSLFAYTSAIGLGRTPLVDFWYTMAPMVIGLAVLVARDVYES